jgi:hypothetical protein
MRPTKRRARDSGQSTPRARSVTYAGYPMLEETHNETSPLRVDEPGPQEDRNDPALGIPNFQRADKTAQAVHEEVRRRLYKDLSKLKNAGFVYILRDPKRPGLLKIGSSMNTGQRWKQIESECGHNVAEVFVSEEVDNCQKAEWLAQGDLWHLCRPHKCSSCRRKHQEWHEVDEEMAIRTVKRWVRFMQEGPYSSEGKLRPIWQYILDKRRLSGSFDHDTRWQRWGYVVSPLRLYDYCKYYYELHGLPFCTLLWAYSWQIANVLAWTMPLIFFRTLVSALPLSISVVCFGVHVYNLKKPALPRK